jgi:hypothetical protein
VYRLPDSRTLVVAASLSLVAGVASAERPLVPTQATQTFLENHVPARAVVAGDQLAAIYGPTLAATAAETGTATFVEAFLADNRDAFGIGNTTMVPAGSVSIRNGEYEVYAYTQQIPSEGLPVHGSLIKVPVWIGPTEKRIAYVGLRVVPEPQEALPDDQMTETDAQNVVLATPDFAHLTNFTPAEKVIFEADDGTLHRTWRFTAYALGQAFLFFIDTNSGGIAGVFNRVVDADVFGSVSGAATPGVGADTEATGGRALDLTYTTHAVEAREKSGGG